MQGTYNVNIPTLALIFTVGSGIGVWIWALSARIQRLDSKLDTQQVLFSQQLTEQQHSFTQQLSSQQKHYDDKMGSVDRELAHLLEILNIRLKISDDKDKQILDSLALQALDLKTISGSVTELKTTAAIIDAVSKARRD